MICHVTIGYTTGVFLIFTHCEADSEKEIGRVKEINDFINAMLKAKLNGTADDDDNFKLMEYNADYKDRVNQTIKRCMKTVGKERDVVLKYYVKFVEDGV